MAEKSECPVCGKEFINMGAHMKVHEDKPEGETVTHSGVPSSAVIQPDDGGPAINLRDFIEGTARTMGNMDKLLQSVNRRLEKIETGGANEFKTKANPEDVERVKAGREGIDERITNIVDELLGSDFGVKVVPNPNNPGFRFDVIVPSRLSDLSVSQRPVYDPATPKTRENPNGYKLNPLGEVVMEDYKPEDVRSRAISSTMSFDAIREHCERVRSYIVATYQKTNRPVPQFNVKDRN
jgi:hypothetical protein